MPEFLIAKSIILGKSYQCSVGIEIYLDLKVCFYLVTYQNFNNLIALSSANQITEISASWWLRQTVPYFVLWYRSPIFYFIFYFLISIVPDTDFILLGFICVNSQPFLWSWRTFNANLKPLAILTPKLLII